MNSVMSVAAVANRYKGVQVATASPVQIVALLFGGILRFTNDADQAMEKDDRGRAGERINKAVTIVDELIATLDPTHAPELAENLTAVYGFARRRLYEANQKWNRQALKDVIAAITPLKEAWDELAKASPTP